jgi:hypothetical protein
MTGTDADAFSALSGRARFHRVDDATVTSLRELSEGL